MVNVKFRKAHLLCSLESSPLYLLECSPLI